MKKKIFYILAFTFFCLLCSQTSFGQNVKEGDKDYGWLDTVIVHGPPKSSSPFPSWPPTLNPAPDPSPTGPGGTPTGGGPTTTGGGTGGDGENNEEDDDDCDITCPAGFILNSNCSCTKKVDEDCKEFKTSTNIPSNSNTYQKGDVVTFKGPFYFSDPNQIPTGLRDKTGTIVRADLVAGYQIIQHGNYYEIPAISYKYNQFSENFHGGTLGGFKGESCPNTSTDTDTGTTGATDTTNSDPTGTYGNSGAFDSGNPCDPSSSTFNVCVCNPASCSGTPPTGPGTGGDDDCENRIACDGVIVDCECVEMKNWYLDRDRDGYDAGTQQSTVFPGEGWVEGNSKGTDCDDDNYNVHQLNKCGKCEVEPEDGVCDDCDTSVEDLKMIFPNTSDAKLKAIADAINKYGAKLGINTKEKLQHFLAQAAVESHNLNAFKEYTNYRPSTA